MKRFRKRQSASTTAARPGGDSGRLGDTCVLGRRRDLNDAPGPPAPGRLAFSRRCICRTRRSIGSRWSNRSGRDNSASPPPSNPVARQAGGGPGVLVVVALEPLVEGAFGLRPRFGHPDLVQQGHHRRGRHGRAPAVRRGAQRPGARHVHRRGRSAERAREGPQTDPQRPPSRAPRRDDSKQTRKDHRPARLAETTLRYEPVVLPCPQAAPVARWMVHAREERPPAKTEPLEWFLLTTVPVRSADDATRILQCYALRRRIEDYFRILKSGCKVEELQQHTAERLERVIAIKMVIACSSHPNTWARRFNCSHASAGGLDAYETPRCAAPVARLYPTRSHDPCLRTARRIRMTSPCMKSSETSGARAGLAGMTGRAGP